MQPFFYKFKNIYYLLLLLLTSISAFAQHVDDGKGLIENSIYMEAGGNGLWYSLNYDKVLKQHKNTALTGRVGFSYLGNFNDTNAITIPLTVSFLYGKNKNFLELGGGPTYLYSFAEKITGIGAIGIIGFRHQPRKEKGIMYRIAFNPFIGEYSTDKGYWNWVWIPWGGISLGFSF